MKVREFMKPQPMTASETDSIGNARQLMTTQHIRHLPVVAGGRVVGMLSERDIFAARARADGDTEWWRMPVRDAMHSPVHTAHPDDSLVEVAARLATFKIGALPVVERGTLVGIITVTDVLDAEVREAMAPSPTATRTGYST